jgi:hypothetical protein
VNIELKREDAGGVNRLWSRADINILIIYYYTLIYRSLLFLNFFIWFDNLPLREGFKKQFLLATGVEWNAHLRLEHLELALEAHVREHHFPLALAILPGDIERPLLFPHQVGAHYASRTRYTCCTMD